MYSSSVSLYAVASAISASVLPFLLISSIAKNSLFPPSIMSVPRPAMFVAIVIAPYLPACATISASFSWFLAFKTSCFNPSFLRSLLIFSEFSIDAVPTSTGCPFSCASFISSITALNLESSVLYIISLLSFLITGKFVGIVTTSRLYISLNSLSSVIAVPVIPANLSYILKKFWNVIVASVFDSSAILTCSLASIAWCNPVRISSSFHYTTCKFINY